MRLYFELGDTHEEIKTDDFRIAAIICMERGVDHFSVVEEEGEGMYSHWDYYFMWQDCDNPLHWEAQGMCCDQKLELTLTKDFISKIKKVRKAAKA